MENQMFKKLIDKKKKEGKDISDVHSSAKSSVLEDLMDHLGGMGVEKLKGMKKVSIASDSKQGLEKGLEKAKEMLHNPQEIGEEESEEHESMESPEMEAGEHEEESEEKSPEELKQEIEELKAKIASMKA